MNLLPRSHEEFAQKDYWNEFFKKRGEKAFEWYGEYLDLCEHIHKYVKKPDKILMLGCGNSKLSIDMYDAGFREIINIDISAVAIRKMLELNAKTRADMQFLQMDATKMSFENERFSVAVDKGTLDALFVDDTPEVCETVHKYLMEMSRVMRIGGRYLCISLLQQHILKYLIDFLIQNSFMVRIINCQDAYLTNQAKNAENPDAVTLPVFMVVATKFKALTSPILEFYLGKDKMQRMKTTEELIEAVTCIQQAAMVCGGLARSSIAGHNEITMDLTQPGEQSPRYTVHVLDQPPVRGQGKYAVFIVPQGREIEWLFSTPEGRKKLAESAQFQRLAIVSMHRDQEYSSLDAVKAELSSSVNCFAPASIKEQIPFLSSGADVGKRETLVCGFSKISGEFRIEDVQTENGKLFRRLIFLSNQSVVQSEALVKTIKPKGKKERKKIDMGYLACQHHIYMSVGVQLATGNKPTAAGKSERDVLVVGLGGGSLCSFLHEGLPHTRVTAVEIDPIMLEVAEQYFELKQDKRFHVVIDDGLAFLQKCQSEDIHFDAVLFDVDSKDLSLGMSCPPASFLEAEVLNNIKQIIGDHGLFVLNFVCRNAELRSEALKNLQGAFSSVCCYKLDEDVNEVIYCANHDKFKSIEAWRKALSASARHLNSVTKQHKLCTDNMLEVTDFVKELKLE